MTVWMRGKTGRRSAGMSCRVETLESRTLLSATTVAAARVPYAPVRPAAVAAPVQPLVTPQHLTASPTAGAGVRLTWDAQSAITQYVVTRATQGGRFINVGSVDGAGAAVFADPSASPNHAYSYEVRATRGTKTSPAARVGPVTVPPAAPSAVVASALGPSSVRLAWVDRDPAAAGYWVLRATDGVHFNTLARLSGGQTSTFVDASATSGHTYAYEVVAVAGRSNSLPSGAASAVTPLVAPAALRATALAGSVNLAWSNADPATGAYVILRSTSGKGGSFSPVAQVNAAANTFCDAAVLPGQAYAYEVEAINAVTASAASSPASAIVPAITGAVSIVSRYGNELVVTAAGDNHAVRLDQSGSCLAITADGQTFNDPVPADGVFVYTRGAGDVLSIGASVAARTTVETIDGNVTAIDSAGSNVSAWIDSSDRFTGLGTVHAVAAFAGGVSTARGACLPDPTDAGNTAAVSLSLWGAGPVADDVNQGEAGDCYFLSSLAAFATVNPARLRESAVDMGDGTYVVQFFNGSQPVYVRVGNDFSTGPFNGFGYAQPGPNDTVWAMVLEKALADFRTGANRYDSINAGWMNEAYADLGIGSADLDPTGRTDAAFYAQVTAALANGRAVTLATFDSPPDLVGDHAYTLVAAYQDAQGIDRYVIRNPWGSSGDALENSRGYATLTFAQVAANFDDGCVALS